MLAPKIDDIKNESGPGVDPRVSEPEEGPREGSRVYLKQSIGRPLERKLLSGKHLKELHEKLQLEEHTVGWVPELKTELHELLEEYSFLFAMDSMDLGKTDLIQHHIELTDFTPIKDRYRRIPPHQYDEVRKHLREMLKIGAIGKISSPWASPVVLVRKKDGSL